MKINTFENILCKYGFVYGIISGILILIALIIAVFTRNAIACVFLLVGFAFGLLHLIFGD